LLRLGIAGFISTIVFASVTLLRKPKFESSAMVAGASSDGLSSRLSGLAMQFGLGDLSSLSEGGAKATADLIIQVSRLESVADSVLSSATRDSAGRSISLQALLLRDRFGHDGSRWDRSRARQKARQVLGRSLVLSRNSQTNTATLTLTTGDAELSRQLLAEHLRRVDAVFRELGRASASEEVAFARARIAERQGQLREAERRLADFVGGNRKYEQSPELQFEYERRRRDVTLHESVLNQLVQSAEEASLRAVRETRSIAIISAPAAPMRPRPRGTLFNSLVGFFCGATVWLLWLQVRAVPFWRPRAR
jgi:uncharacterized protein involved in exopolysaccharide biosynthesis